MVFDDGTMRAELLTRQRPHARRCVCRLPKQRILFSGDARVNGPGITWAMATPLTG